MTACVNRKHTKKVAAVVTASLVGALSLGVAPVAAMATDEGIDMQTVESANAFSDGTVTADVYYGTDLVTNLSDITYDSAKAIKVVPKTINIPGDGVPAYDISDSSVYKVSYYNADKDGKPTGDAILAPSAAGSYVAVIEATSGHYAGGKALFAFKINAKSMAAAVPVSVRPDGSTVAINDTNVVYTASEQQIGFELDGELLTEGVDYSVEYHTAYGDMTDATLIDGAPVDAGDYVAVIKGMGNYAGSEADIQKTVKVNKVDLSRCTVENITTDSESLPTMPESIVLQNGVRVADEALLSQLALSFDSADNGDIMYKNNGAYTFTVTVADKDNENIINSSVAGDVKHIKVYKVEELASWTYDDEALGTEWKTVLEDLKKFPQWSTAEVDASSADGKTVANTDNGLLVRNCYIAGTNTPAADGWSETPGVYDVVLEVNASATGYKLGGTFTVRLTVVQDVLDADASVYVSYGDKVVTSVEKDFDGKPIKASDFYVEVRNADGTPVSEFSVKLVDSEGRTVSEALNAGSYSLVIESDAYELTGTTEVPVTINKVDLSSIRSALGKVSGGVDYIETQTAGLTLAGLKLEYLTDVDADEDGELDWEALPSAVYNTDHIKIEKLDVKTGEWTDITNRVDKFSVEGQYRISLFPHTEVEYGNYEFATDKGTTVEYRVVNKSKFLFDDVNLDYWGFDTIYEVAKKGVEYMNGYNGTKLFGPNDTITRGQVACVLFNMAGGSMDETDSDWYNEVAGWKSFDDVDGMQYYGEAIAWAKKTGVVNGYADGTFKADAPVIREEFAAMLANYAKKVGDYKTVGTDEVLASMPDGGQVSDWAKDVVAWAVDAEVMGNGGVINPTSSITRGEAAGMVYNYDLA